MLEMVKVFHCLFAGPCTGCSFAAEERLGAVYGGVGTSPAVPPERDGSVLARQPSPPVQPVPGAVRCSTAVCVLFVRVYVCVCVCG